MKGADEETRACHSTRRLVIALHRYSIGRYSVSSGVGLEVQTPSLRKCRSILLGRISDSVEKCPVGGGRKCRSPPTTLSEKTSSASENKIQAQNHPVQSVLAGIRLTRPLVQRSGVNIKEGFQKEKVRFMGMRSTLSESAQELDCGISPANNR